GRASGTGARSGRARAARRRAHPEPPRAPARGRRGGGRSFVRDVASWRGPCFFSRHGRPVHSGAGGGRRMALRIGINGFGRIGRLVYRVAAERGIEVVAVNDLVPADNLAYLLEHDTMHRRFTLGGKPAAVSAGEDRFTVNGKVTRTLSVRSPA